MVATAGCGPMVAAAGSEGTSTTEGEGSVDSRGSGGDDAITITGATATSGTDAADTGAIDPPIDCAATGVCDEECAQWEAEYQGPAGESDQFGAVAIAEGGTIVVAGMRDWVQGSGAGDLVLLGYDDAGELSWEATPLGTDDAMLQSAASVAIANDGSIAIAGHALTPAGSRGWFIMHATEEEDQRLFEFATGVLVSTVLFALDDSLIVAGGSDTGGGFVHRYSAAGTFIEEWEGDQLGLPAGFVLGAVPTSDSTIALAGSSDGGGGDVWLASLDFEDGLQWSTIFDGDPSTSQWADDIAVMPDGDLLLVGTEHDADYNGLSWVGRFAPDGSQRWARAYEGTGCCANALEHVEVTPDGRIFALGVRGGEGLRLKVQELDCNGELVWEWNHESPSQDSAFPGGLAWSPELGLVVAGSDYISMSDQRGYLVRLTP